jgi:hypothetical protein
LGTGEGLAGVLCQQGQQVELRAGEFDDFLGAADFVALQIYFQITHAHQSRLMHPTADAAQHGAHPRH